MPDDSFTALVQWFASLGVGGALGGMMFNFYRKDMKENADRLKEFIDSWKTETAGWKTVVSENTKAMSECTKMTEQVFNYLLAISSVLEQKKTDTRDGARN